MDDLTPYYHQLLFCCKKVHGILKVIRASVIATSGDLLQNILNKFTMLLTRQYTRKISVGRFANVGKI